MSTLTDIPGQFQFRPAELPSRFDVPCPFLESQLRLQNDHILCPADGHGLSQHFRCALIGVVKLAHPAQVPRGEAGDVRVRTAQILRRSDSGAFLRPAADQPANLAVQFHLRQICRHQGIQRREHGAVVYRFSDVHPAPPFRRGCACFLFSAFEIANEQTLGFNPSEGLRLSGIRSCHCYSHCSSTICSHWTMKRSSTTQF